MTCDICGKPAHITMTTADGETVRACCVVHLVPNRAIYELFEPAT